MLIICQEPFYITLFNPHNHATHGCDYSHFINEDTEAKRAYVIGHCQITIIIRTKFQVPLVFCSPDHLCNTTLSCTLLILRKWSPYSLTVIMYTNKALSLEACRVSRCLPGSICLTHPEQSGLQGLTHTEGSELMSPV